MKKKLTQRILMRMSTGFLMVVTIACSMAFAEDSYGQKYLDKNLTVVFDSKPLQTALEEVATKVGAKLVFPDGLVSGRNAVSIKLNKTKAGEVLSHLLTPHGLEFVAVGEMIVVRKAGAAMQPVALAPRTAQPASLSGSVTDSLGIALEGVTVSHRPPSGTGTTTDAAGRYTIGLPDDGILVFSRVGYRTREVAIEGQSRLDIILSLADGGLDEVVVIGYGQRQSKVSVTGAVSSIQTKELRQSPVANLTNALAGRLPGLFTAQRSGRPGSDASNLFIRGLSTYAGNTAPLVVIDGLPRGDANFGDIDPNEVESVTILKDAASTALYGIQGANGIILVTTRRGRESVPNIQVNSQYTLQQPTRRTRFLDSYTTAQLQNEAAANDGVAPVFTDEQLAHYRDQTRPALYPDVDWFSYLMRGSTPQLQSNINVNGGSRYVRYFASGSFLNQQPIYRHAAENVYGVDYKYNRYNFRSNVDITLTKTLDLQVDLASRLENRTGPSNDRGDGNYFFILLSQLGNHITPVFNPDGSIAIGSLPSEYQNPYGVLTQNGYFNDFYHSTNGNIAVTRKLDFITKGLSVRGLFSFENYGTIAFGQYQNFDSFRYSVNQQTGADIYSRYSTKTSLGRAGDLNGERYFYYDLKLFYNRAFGDHAFDGIFLFNRNYRSQFANLPRVYEGFVGRLAYSFRNRYFAEFNAGYNGSENFPPGRRYGFFPAVSAAWVISDESFWGDVSVMNRLKLRASHGYVGNDRIGSDRWMFISDYAPNGGFTFGSTPNWQGGYTENRVGNTAITWERAAKSNVGLEMGLLKNRITASVDAFYEKRTNILTPALTLPDYIGITAAINRNKGVVENKGLEAEVTMNAAIGQVQIFSRVNYTLARNKILDMDEPDLEFPYQSNVGLPIGYGLGYQAEGLFGNAAEIESHARQAFSSRLIPGDIKYRDIDGNGVINDADRIMIPMLNIPTGVVGFTLGINYRGVDASVLLQGAWGGSQIYSAQLTQALRLGYRPHHLGRWTPETAASATFPVLHIQEANAANNFVTSTYWVERTDYLKLKNAEVGYQLPARFTKQVGLSAVRLFANGLNLISWDNLGHLGVDPESNTGGRYGWQPYPIQRLYNMGVSVTF